MQDMKYRPNGMGGVCLSREKAEEVLKASPAYDKFLDLTDEMQDEVLSFVMGNRGIKMTYDPFFKRIFDPLLHGDRLSRLLSQILKQEVKVKQVLPAQSRRLSAEASLIIMDIVVELESGALANVEIQKVGYHFPGQRSACYSSDLVIRQYDKLKSLNKKQFSYRDLQRVYTIVLMEKSPVQFHEIPDTYYHHSRQVFDSGLEMELLQEYIFIALDIFRENTQNISEELDAWMFFLSSDRPEDIMKVLEAYPCFRELYAEVAEFQKKPEELIHMYNETLALFDKNTVALMIEEQQEELKKQQEEIKRQREESNRQWEEFNRLQEEIEKRREESKRQREESKRQQEEFERLREESKRQQEEFERQQEESKRQQEEFERQQEESKRKQEEFNRQQEENKKLKEEIEFLQKQLKSLT